MNQFPLMYCRPSTMNQIPLMYCRPCTINQFPLMYCRPSTINQFPLMYYNYDNISIQSLTLLNITILLSFRSGRVAPLDFGTRRASAEVPRIFNILVWVVVRVCVFVDMRIWRVPSLTRYIIHCDVSIPLVYFCKPIL
jgi:hypothetical protein